jgi:hypothetical protein
MAAIVQASGRLKQEQEPILNKIRIYKELRIFQSFTIFNWIKEPLPLASP